MCNEFHFEIRAGTSNDKKCSIPSFPLSRLQDQPSCFTHHFYAQVTQFVYAYMFVVVAG